MNIFKKKDGAKVYVNGNKDVIINKDGKVITEINKKTKSQVEKSVKEGKWEPVDKEYLLKVKKIV